MLKFIDVKETRRLSRLKNVKSSIGSTISHNGWLKKQIEKRRIEKLRQRKDEAKKKPIGDGIQVDTKISKSDAVSKCGLKLKMTNTQEESSRNSYRRMTNQVEKSTNVPALMEKETQALNLSAASLQRRDQTSILRKHSTNQPTDRTSSTKLNGSIGCGSERRPCRVNKGKENNHYRENPYKNKSHHEDAVEHMGTTKKRSTASKHFYMDIVSLRREHADAIKMLEELDINEGNKRRSLVSSNDHSTDLIDADDDVTGSSDVEMKEQRSPGVLKARRLCGNDDVVLDDGSKEEDYSSSISRSDNSSVTTGEDGEAHHSSGGRAGMHEQNRLINEKERSERIIGEDSCCAGGSCKFNVNSKLILDKNVEEVKYSAVVADKEVENIYTDDSFLNNMTHLSISLRDDFDNEGSEVEEFIGEEEVELEECVSSPI